MQLAFTAPVVNTCVANPYFTLKLNPLSTRRKHGIYFGRCTTFCRKHLKNGQVLWVCVRVFLRIISIPHFKDFSLTLTSMLHAFPQKDAKQGKAYM
jgi:hypothetical protein